MKYNYFLIFIVGLLLISSGCNKQSSVYTYTIVNQTDKVINVYIYRTLSDYSDGQYNVVGGSINPNSTFPIPSNVLLDSRDYYIDWYSADFNYSNWGDSSAVNKFTPSRDQNIFYIAPTKPNNIRKVCLSGNLDVTSWKAVDAFADSADVSIWSNLTPVQKYQQIILNRNLTATRYYTTVLTDTAHDDLIYHTGTDSVAVKISFNAPYNFQMIANYSPITGKFTPSADSALAIIGTKRYLMVKQ